MNLEKIKNGNKQICNNSLFLKVSAKGFPIIKTSLDKLLSNPEQQQFQMPDLINILIEDGNTIRVIYTTGHWLDIDAVEDLVAAGDFNA